MIELPVTPILDVGGWELGKALKLLLDGNAVIIEWLTSPLTYSADAAFRSEFLSLAQRLADRRLVGKHYYYLARRQAERFLGSETVALKKIFYVLRPLVALRWLDRYTDHTIAPMHFPTLCEEADLGDALSGEIEALRIRKAQSRELGAGAMPDHIASFIRTELDSAKRWAETRSPRNRHEAHREVDAFWRKWIEISASRHTPV